MKTPIEIVLNSRKFNDEIKIDLNAVKAREWAWMFPNLVHRYLQSYKSIEKDIEMLKRLKHPVMIAQRILSLLAMYDLYGEKTHLDRAESFIDILIDENYIVDFENSILFPYKFDYEGLIRCKAPWFSGMAQGQVLSAFSVFFKIYK